MTFARVNPGGWAVGAQLTSGQQNQLDIDHANALDKSAAGDTLLGVVTIGGGGAQIVANSANAVESTFTSGITTNVAGGISSQAVGGIILRGGATDWVTFFPSRTRTLWVPPHSRSGNTAWGNSQGFPVVFGPGTISQELFFLPGLHQGATLSSLVVAIQVFDTHAGGVPSNLPTASVIRMPFVGAGLSTQALSTTAVQSFSPAPGSGAAWYNGNNWQFWTYTCNQNNVIDTTQFTYAVLLVDENGANSHSTNSYGGFFLNYSGITSSQFP